MDRTYSLHLPDRPHTGTLVVMLHGCVQPAREFAVATRMNDAAGERGWGVLWPEQSDRAHELRCWNWYLPENQRRDGGEAALLATMIRGVCDEHGFERVALAGISAGAAMTAILAANYPELFAAIAMHSGVAFGAAASVAQALAVMRDGAGEPLALGRHVREAMGGRRRVMPALVLHGGKDAALNPVNGTLLAQQWAVANAGELPPAQERVHVEEGRYDATVVAYEGASVEEWRIAPLGHAWSGGSPEATYSDPKGPDATAAIVGFFARHLSPLPTLTSSPTTSST